MHLGIVIYIFPSQMVCNLEDNSQLVIFPSICYSFTTQHLEGDSSQFLRLTAEHLVNGAQCGGSGGRRHECLWIKRCNHNAWLTGG